MQIILNTNDIVLIKSKATNREVVLTQDNISCVFMIPINRLKEENAEYGSISYGYDIPNRGEIFYSSCKNSAEESITKAKKMIARGIDIHYIARLWNIKNVGCFFRIIWTKDGLGDCGYELIDNGIYKHPSY